MTMHSREFIATHQGVEAYYEAEIPRKSFIPMLATRSGGWARRKVPGPRDDTGFANEPGIPFYKIVRTGCPNFVRQWDEGERRG